MGEKQKYEVLSQLMVGGKIYTPGETIELPVKLADALPAGTVRLATVQCAVTSDETVARLEYTIEALNKELAAERATKAELEKALENAKARIAKLESKAKPKQE